MVPEFLHDFVIIFQTIYLHNLPHDFQALCFISLFTVSIDIVLNDRIISEKKNIFRRKISQRNLSIVTAFSCRD